MTNEEAIVRGRSVASGRGWSWREPARVIRSRRGLAGPIVLVVLTTMNRRGECVRIEFDARTGHMLEADFDTR